MDILLKGIIAGLLLGFPAGPIGAIAIRTMLVKGASHGIFLGLGCALVDVIYSSIIGLGAKYASNFLISYQFWIGILGGMVLVVIGIKIFFSKPVIDSDLACSGKQYFGSFALAFMLAFTSPATLLSFSAVFASLNLGFSTINSSAAVNTVFGVVIGGTVWWVILGISIKRFESKINSKVLKYANKVFGILIISLAIYINI